MKRRNALMALGPFALLLTIFAGQATAQSNTVPVQAPSAQETRQRTTINLNGEYRNEEDQRIKVVQEGDRIRAHWLDAGSDRLNTRCKGDLYLDGKIEGNTVKGDRIFCTNKRRATLNMTIKEGGDLLEFPGEGDSGGKYSTVQYRRVTPGK